MSERRAAGLIDEGLNEALDKVIYEGEPEGRRGPSGVEAPSTWPVVGQQIELQSPPLLDQTGTVSSWEVAASSPPFAALSPLGQAPQIDPGLPVMVSLRSGPRFSELEGVVTDVWSTGHLNVRLTPPEQRRYPRYRREILVKLQWLDPSTRMVKSLSCVTVDLSFGGLRVRLFEPITRGDRMFVFIPVPQQDPIQAVVRVVREELVSDDGWRQVGLEFTTVSEAHRARLLQFLSGERAAHT